MERVKFLKRMKYRVFLCDLPGRALGMTDYNDRIILIDPFMNIVDTYIHEYCHVRHPKLSERKIEQMTRRIRSRMSRKEVDRLAKYVITKCQRAWI